MASIILWSQLSVVSNRAKRIDVRNASYGNVSQTSNMGADSKFGPIRIYTFTDLGEHLQKGASLHKSKQTEKESLKSSPQFKLLSSHIVLPTILHSHMCSRLQGASALLFPSQRRTGCTCSVLSEPRVGAQTRSTQWRRTQAISVLSAP